MYDASKEAFNQQVFVRMLGSSIKLSLLSRRTSKVQLREIQLRQNRAKPPVFMHALHIRRHVTSH